jgi:uncharacterized LabA/DUF88 family protein
VSKPRLNIYIDGMNFSIASRRLAGANVDMGVFARMLAAKLGAELGTIYYYTAEVGAAGEARDRQKKFFAALRHIPELVLVLGKHKRRTDGDGEEYYVEKGTDVNLAVDLVAGAYEDSYDVAVLVGGDTDQVRALERTRTVGKRAIWARCENQAHDNDMAAAASEEMVLTATTLRMCRRVSPAASRREAAASQQAAAAQRQARMLEIVDAIQTAPGIEQPRSTTARPSS